MIETWVPDKLKSFRDLHVALSDTPESIFGVQKLSNGQTSAQTKL